MQLEPPADHACTQATSGFGSAFAETTSSGEEDSLESACGVHSEDSSMTGGAVDETQRCVWDAYIMWSEPEVGM